MLHKRLDCEVRKYLSNLCSRLSKNDRRDLESFLAAVDRVYVDLDEDRTTLERAMNISSRELLETVEERKRLENEVAQQQARLFHAAKMSELGRMASGIAHEINNPLALIKANSGLAKDIMGDGKPDFSEVVRLLDQIELMTTRIANIISGLRTFSRDGGRDPFLPADLHTLIKESLWICGERFKKNKIDVIVDVAPGCTIKCRATQISQVLVNLINNSCDAIGELSEKWIRIEFKCTSEFVEISVTDSGRGIDKKILPDIFDPFFTTKEVGKGTGLGLCISFGIAKIHGGELIYDENSQHTRFILRLAKEPVSHSDAAA